MMLPRKIYNQVSTAQMLDQDSNEDFCADHKSHLAMQQVCRRAKQMWNDWLSMQLYSLNHKPTVV